MAKRIGELLVQSGIIIKDQVNEALELQKTKKKKLGEILMELGYVHSDVLIRMLSEQAAIPFIELKLEMLDEDLIKSFPEEFLYKNKIIPLYEIKDKLHVAIGDPTNHEVIKKLKTYTEKEIVLSGAEPERIVRLLDKFFLIDMTNYLFNESTGE
jgi:type IV pilus assembly protein PilB